MSLERHFAKKLNFWSILRPQGGPKRGTWKKGFVKNYEIFGLVFGEKAHSGQFSPFFQFLYRFGAKF